jgi:capsular exopolysaccharide synthesis family protein
LRINLEFATGGKLVRRLAVISAFQGEGKSTTTVNLALAYAQAGKRTLLIDADMRRPSLHHVLQVSNHSGLSDALRDLPKAVSVIRDTGIPNLHVIPSGRTPYNPSELLASSAFSDLLNMMQERFDVIVIDTPPALSAMDAKVVAAKCDGAVLVIQQGKVKREDGRKVKEELESAGARLLGVALNKMNAKDIEKYPY